MQKPRYKNFWKVVRKYRKKFYGELKNKGLLFVFLDMQRVLFFEGFNVPLSPEEMAEKSGHDLQEIERVGDILEHSGLVKTVTINDMIYYDIGGML